MHILRDTTFVYTIRVDSDEGERSNDVRRLNEIAPQMVARRQATSERMHARFPEVDVIYEEMSRAATPFTVARPQV